MSFISILRKIGQIAGIAAPEIISIINPPMGAIAGTVLQSILMAEARVGPGNGDEKKQDALSYIQVALPLLLQLMQVTAGKQLADEKLLTSGFDKLNDGMVDILNAFRVLPKTS